VLESRCRPRARDPFDALRRDRFGVVSMNPMQAVERNLAIDALEHRRSARAIVSP